MPTELQTKFKIAIANIVTRIAEVSGEGNSVASNIGVEEQLLIDIICESLGIERAADVTELVVGSQETKHSSLR